MPAYQRFECIGNLGREPEMRYTPKGKAVTNFPVAVNERYTDSEGEDHETTTWIRITTWGAQAEACKQYLTKGSSVFVTGKLIADPETGGPRIWGEDEAKANFEVRAETVVFLDSKKERGEEEEEEEDEPFRKPKPPVKKKKTIKTGGGKQPWMAG